MLAGQPVQANIKQHEVKCLAQVMHVEASGEGLIGQTAVAMTVINRKKSGKYPSDICKVIAQPNQFPWFKKKGGKVNPPIKFIQKAQIVLDTYYTQEKIPCERLSSLTNAIYFNTIQIPGTKKIDKIGGHVFSK
jgi:N-acetylmuramoyl-L-alanine amidase